MGLLRASSALVLGFLFFFGAIGNSAFSQEEEREETMDYSPEGQANVDDPISDATIQGAGQGAVSTDGNTTIYGQDFFARFPNAISVLDIINRIPAGKRILDASGNDQSRGFSRNTDLILINGKRMSGKSNDSQTALQRITVDQVERVEIIRGTSPDIKVNSQESILNIVLKEGAGGGSGTWRFDTEVKPGKQVMWGGFLSYGGSVGDLEYFVSMRTDPGHRAFPQIERTFDGMGVFQSRLDEIINRRFRGNNFTANLGYTFKDGSIMHLNGLYYFENFSDTTPGIISTPDGMGGLMFFGNSARFVGIPNDRYEIGGDYERSLGEKWTLKILGLYSVNSEDLVQREDFLIEGPNPVDDFIFMDENRATELIGRASITWQASPKHSIEFGTEQAVNNLDVDLTLVQNDGMGNLLPVDIPSSNVTIREVRNESFIIHSWQINSKANLDTSIFVENFTISQEGVGVDTSQKFFFIRPSWNFRYNLTPSTQLQLSVKRDIFQLDFRDFAASASDDDEVIAGNTELRPEKQWRYEISVEHSLPNDGGRIKLTGAFEQRIDRIERVEIAPLVDGVGNVGRGHRFLVIFESSIRLGFLGLPDFIIEPRVEYYPTRITDPFTGQLRNFNGWDTHNARIGWRHDVNSLGLSYGGEFAYYPTWRWQDINEQLISIHRYRLDFFLEKKLYKSIKLRLDAWNLLNYDEGRTRLFFEGGRASGIITETIFRTRREGRNFQISFQGAF